MEFLKGLLPFIIKIAKAVAGSYPIGLLVIGIIEKITNEANKKDGISDASVKDILVAVAKSKANNIDQIKLLKALKALGLDTVTEEEMQGIPKKIKKVAVSKVEETLEKVEEVLKK